MKEWFISRKQAFKKASLGDKLQLGVTAILIILCVGFKLSLLPLLCYVLFLELQELHYRQSYEELQDKVEDN